MATDHGRQQTNTIPDQLDGAPGALAPTERELRALRRGLGIPVIATNEEFLTQGQRVPKRKMQLTDSDNESEEFSNSSERYSTSESDGDYASDDHRVAGEDDMAGRANIGHRRDLLLLQDSRFASDRTKMRLWHELRYVRSLWSREKEYKLCQDCASVTDGNDIQSTSNSMLWTASFDRYGVPLSDIFTYGIRPHLSCLRKSRKKILGAQFCDLLTSIMVHPIFQGNAAMLRYILQVIVRMRVDMHVPPMGTMPDLDDTHLDQVNVLAEALLLEEDTPEERTLMHADAYLIVSQKHGVRFHPDVVMLENRLTAHFANEGYAHTAPRDDAPYARSLFYVQLWDLDFLVNVLDSLAIRAPHRYLSVGRYKSMWINDTYKIQAYFAKNLDNLIQQWFLSDERNYRIRQALKCENRQRHLYDIPEEDFSPTYAKSQFVTNKMRAVLEGEYLEALCPPCPLENSSPQGLVVSSTDATGHPGNQSLVSGSPDVAIDAAASPFVGEREHGNAINAVQSPVDADSLPRDIPMKSVEESFTTATAGATLDDLKTSPEAEVRSEADTETDVDEKPHKNRNDDRAYDGDADETEDDDVQMQSRSKISRVSIQSMASSQFEDGQRDRLYSPSHGLFARRGLPPSDRQ